ncbi:hypothetical protein [Microbacterium sp. ZW T5_56]|uniref:hypothetical protein n=1 Tax=Microbacterium sp. ZW T5_56 TaxID=3378081 RepID=UPI003852C503
MADDESGTGSASPGGGEAPDADAVPPLGAEAAPGNDVVVESAVREDLVSEDILAEIDPDHTGWTAEISVIRQIPAPADDPELRGAPPVSDEPVSQPTPQQPEALWAPAALVRKGIGGSALSFSISALIGSCVVGWLFPLGIFALILGIVAVRRPAESTSLGRWAIGLSILSLVYSAGWIWWVGRQIGWWF